jgi:hypothetical protein
MERAPATPADGKPALDTVAHAGKVFEGLLFPDQGPSNAPASEPDETIDPTVEATLEEEPIVEEDAPAEAPPAEEVDEEPAPEVDPEAEVTPTPRARKVKLPDGTEEEVTEDEAYAGYLRQQDYTRKTQMAAEERKLAQAARADAQNARSAHLAALEEQRQAMDAMVPQEPNWAELRARLTPDQYATAQDNWRLFDNRRKEIDAEQKRVATEMDKEAARDLAERSAFEEQQLLNVLPSWRDPVKQKAERSKLVNWLRNKGFSDEQISTVGDHRLVVSLRNAMLWEELQGGSRPKVIGKNPKSPRIAGPGAPLTPAKPKADQSRQKAKDKLAETGRVGDAAKVFEHLI